MSCFSGSGFDENPGSTQVTIGNGECQIESITSDEIICKTPPESGEMMDIYPGNAGLTYELWLNTGDIDTNAGWEVLNGTMPDHTHHIKYEAIIEEPLFNETNDYVARMYGYFVAPYSGEFKIWTSSSDRHSLFFSNTSASSAQSIIITGVCENPYHDKGCSTEWLDLIGGHMYFIALIHNQRGIRSAGNFLKISLQSPKTSVTSEQSSWVTPHRQSFWMGDYPNDEAQSFFINGDIPNDFYLTLNGVNRYIPFDTLDPLNTWTSQVDHYVNPYCTYEAGTDENTLWYQGAETDEKLSQEQGWHDQRYEAYCGRKVIQTPYRLIRNPPVNTDIRTWKYVCFAHRSNSGHDSISGRFRWTNTNGHERTNWITLGHGLGMKPDEWQYLCIDMLDRFDANIQNRNPSKPVLLKEIHIGYSWSRKAFHMIDEFRIAKQEIFINRLPSAVASDMVFEESTIEDEIEDVVDYKLAFPREDLTCSSNRFPLFGIASATQGSNCTLMEINSYDEAMINSYLQDETVVNATFHCDDWPANTSITIMRQRQFSRAVEGTFSVTFNNITVELPPYLEAWELEPIVASAWGFECPIDRYGTCWDRQYHFRWSCQGGYQPPFSTSTDNVFSPDNTTIRNKTHKYDDGYAFFATTGPDFFRTAETQPQIQIMVNDYPAWCLADDCSYIYNASISTTLTSVSDSPDGFGNVGLTLYGTGFTTSDDVLVHIGDMMCNISAVTDTSIVCNLATPVAGTYDVNVIVKSKGEATTSGSPLNVTVALVVSTIAPLTGSIGGGTTLVVTGNPTKLQYFS